MFPWQSGSDGTEATPRLLFNLRSGRWIDDNSGLQRHVGVAIAYNVWQYYQVSADIDFMASFGAELLLEIARFLASITSYNAVFDRYEIRGVVGPDEYHDAYTESAEPGLRNNAYTNVMTAWVLCRALDVLEVLESPHRERIVDLIGLGRDELERWEEISRKLVIPFHGDGIISQFEGYGARARRALRPARLPVRVRDDPRNIAYYTQRTAHGSTLSRIVQSWVLSRVDREGSWHFFTEALESDIADIQGGSTREGIHLGAMAGTIDLVQRCHTGVGYRQHWIELEFTSAHVRIQTMPGRAPPIRLGFRGEVFEMGAGETRQLELATAG